MATSGHELLTVVIGDFSPLLSTGLRVALDRDPSLEILAFGLAEEALVDTVTAHGPSVAIIPQPRARALVARLNALRCPTVPIVIARAPNRHYGLELLASGATCLSEATSIEELLAAVYLTRRGVRVFSTPDERLERTWTAAESILTKRERQVLVLLSRDRRNREIASELGISVETVRKHIANVKRKLGAGGRQDLAELRTSRLCTANTGVDN